MFKHFMIELIYGCMFSGKTSELIRRLRKEEIAGRKVQLFKPSIDNRYSIEEVVSHDQIKKKSIIVPDIDTLVESLDPKVEVIGIDEVQFFNAKVIDFCLKQSNLGKKVICSSLNFNHKGQPFKFKNSKKHIGDLLIYSIPTLLTAVCTYKLDDKICGKDAYYTELLVSIKEYGKGPLIGGKEKYAPRCFEHFKKF